METKEKINSLINENDVCLFMKGTPDSPQCGFSMAVSNVLKHLKVNFKGVNVWERWTKKPFHKEKNYLKLSWVIFNN